MAMNRILIIGILISTFCSVLSGSNSDAKAIVRGIVLDTEGNTLFGANVYIKGRYEGAMSDENGKFLFETNFEGECILVATYVGYKVYENSIHISKNRTLELKVTLRKDVVEMKGIVVTASSFTSGEEERVTLTPLEIVTTPGAAADVCWAIKTFPGVSQVEEGAGLFVRGGEVIETKFILDGAEISHPYRYESPTGGFFGTFSPFLLKGIYFSSGGFSSEYGDALSSVLAMQSLGMPSSRSINLGVGLAAFSTMIRLPIVREKFGLSFSANKSNTEYLFKLNRSQQNFTRYPSSWDVNLNLIYKFSKTAQLKFFLFGESDEVGVEVGNPTYRSIYNGETSNRFYNIQYKQLFGEKLYITSNICHNQFDTQNRLNVLDIKQSDRSYQFKLSGEYTVNYAISFLIGTQHFYNLVNINGRIPQDEDDLSPDAPYDDIETNYESYRHALLLETRLNIANRLFLTEGARLDFESISEKLNFDPRISAVYKISEFNSFKFAFGIYHQYPAPSYYDETIGNPQLTSMRAYHYILGYEFDNDDVLFRLEGYYKDYENLLLEDSLVNYTNDGYGYGKGVDIFLKKSFWEINSRISYSYLIARRHYHEFTELTSPDFDITHNLTVVLDYSPIPYFGISTCYRYATGKPYTPAPGEYNSNRVADYHKLDIDLSYLHSFFERNLTVFYVGFSNITGRINIFDYLYSPDWSERIPVKSSFGKSIYFGISVSL
ncbi:TonB-dependent receptor [candidate division WOR-3 bacterium]|nr:TonB-dependent receptor [candidate division WOR-3 bacterium]